MTAYQKFQNYAVRFSSYHISTYAASASFFIITAVFPLLMLTLSIVSFTPLSTQDFIEMIALMLPETFTPLLNRIASELMTSSTTALSLSLVATLWTAAKSMLGLLDGLNAIADVNDTRNFVFKRVLCIGYMLVLIVGLLFNLALRVFGQHIQSLLESTFPPLSHAFSSVMQQRGLTLFLILMVVFMLVYTAFPSKKLKFLLQLPGAAFTSAAWLAFSALFSIYVNRIGQFSTIYGSLTMMILAMLWLYFCMYFVFLGAVFNKLYPEWFWKSFIALKRGRDCRRELRNEKRKLTEQNEDRTH